MFKKKYPKAETERDRTENSDTYSLQDQKNKEQLHLAQSMRIDSTNTSKPLKGEKPAKHKGVTQMISSSSKTSATEMSKKGSEGKQMRNIL